MLDPKYKKSDGFTFIETMIGVALILIVFLGIFGAYRFGLKVVTQSKNRIIATAIANREIEIIRNLPYESIGIQGDPLFPNGVLEATKTTLSNNIEFTIETDVDYVIDSLDGLAEPEDPCPYDYKKVENKVSWSGLFEGEVKFITDVSPKNLAQECIAEGGILAVNVFDAFGQMVSVPLIQVIDPNTGEEIDFATPADGKHYFALAPSTYKVVVSKDGYSVDRSYGTDEVTTPEKPHPIILEGQLTENSFSIDKLSSMSVETRGTKGAGYPVIHNVTFTLTGTKTIGTDSDENPVYKYSQSHITNGPAEIEIPNLEWDSYSFSVNPASGLDLIDIESPPGTSTTQPIDLLPDSSQNVRLILKAENSLLITVQNASTTEPIFSASARLFNTSLGYDATQYTDEEGQTYFIPLEENDYNLEIQASGYLDATDTIWVSGDVSKTINLEQIE